MLASITPLGERGRNQRWGATMATFVVGSVAGGGAVGGMLGWLGHQVLGPRSGPARLLALGVSLLLCVAVDAGAGSLRLPSTRRQVNEDWLLRYRGWVYGVAFGFQLGVGVVTVVTTAAVYLTLAAEFLTGSAMAGALVGGAFGLLRAVPVLLTAGIKLPVELIGLHRRLRAWDRPALRVVLVFEALLAVVAIAIGAAA